MIGVRYIKKSLNRRPVYRGSTVFNECFCQIYFTLNVFFHVKQPFGIAGHLLVQRVTLLAASTNGCVCKRGWGRVDKSWVVTSHV
jgi:hypothetical protein